MDGMRIQLWDDGDDSENLRLNYPEIAKAEWIAPTIRLFAIDIQKNPYISVGEWFSKLSDRSVAELQDLAEGCVDANPEDEEQSEFYQQLILLSQMLAHAESTQNMSDTDYVNEQFAKLLTIITMVSLQRKGLIRVFYENLTLGRDMDDKCVAERI